MIHHLKTWPKYFRAVKERRKLFEIRFAGDRDFAVDDLLMLHEWDPLSKNYTGNSELVRVTFIMSGQFGIDVDYVAMGITPPLTVQEAFPVTELK